MTTERGPSTRYEAVLQQIDAELQHVSRRAQAAFFALCGEGLLPLYKQFQARTGFGNAEVLAQALTHVRAFVTGSTPHDQSGLRASFARITPHGDDFDAPGSTVAQDVIICIDVAVQCASLEGNGDPGAVWYAFEPLIMALTQRDYEVLQLGSGDDEQEWLDAVVDDPDMARALRYCMTTVHALSGQDTIASDLLDELGSGASALRPPIVEEMLVKEKE